MRTNPARRQRRPCIASPLADAVSRMPNSRRAELRGNGYGLEIALGDFSGARSPAAQRVPLRNNC